MSTVEHSGAGSGGLVGPGGDSGRDPVRTVVRGIGELLITAGLVVLLFVVYEVYVTDIMSAAKQRDATAELDQQWQQSTPEAERQRTENYNRPEGQGIAKMYIPAFGADYAFTILQGTTEETLEVGPGRYTDSGEPGAPGNFAVAGHRVGKGAPFNDIDLLESCDAIVVETQYSWFVYRVLPKRDEVASWATTKGADPRCAGTGPLGGEYSGVVGQQIVAPSDGSVILPVPGRADVRPDKGQEAALMTLTTCHPRFSDRERLIVHAVMVKQWAKNPDQPGETPPELKETS
ncbi:class E sortase [Actinokineospora pegani]|uniref:class E sortase n=1 Tax=Actinokineospora pegani TaxID=2654637 RepID=UPI0012E9F5FC|nr:class E sortase [Actinokineospora pegani]